MKPGFRKPSKVIGSSVVFRNAVGDDAQFILNLRTNPDKGKFLSKTSADLGAQVDWLDRYSTDPDQVYFIIENLSGERFGTVRLYDQKADSFCWGSWILSEGRPGGFAVESALMVYEFALALGFVRAHFDVRRGNESVWQFHERFGAVRVRETDEDFFYEISLDAINASLERYRKFLPNGIEIVW
jgi:RimJ/RimL family protein N-acetyltransferase